MYDYQLHAESHSCLSDRREGESDLANDSIPPVGGWASSRSDRHLLPTLSLSHTHAHTHTHTDTHTHTPELLTHCLSFTNTHTLSHIHAIFLSLAHAQAHACAHTHTFVQC